MVKNQTHPEGNNKNIHVPQSKTESCENHFVGMESVRINLNQ